MVYRIRLGSEGGFSFKGLFDFGIPPIPGIMVQVREFIKDLSFRNKKEKQLKTFEVTEKALDIADRVLTGMAEGGPEVRPLYVKALKVLGLELDNLLALESKGKLADISENIDYLSP